MATIKNKSRVPAAAEFRRQAEEQLRAKSTAEGDLCTDKDMQRVVHELEVHQIELEMQNRELCQFRDELELTLEKNTELYDFAPVGYCTINGNFQVSWTYDIRGQIPGQILFKDD